MTLPTFLFQFSFIHLKLTLTLPTNSLSFRSFFFTTFPLSLSLSLLWHSRSLLVNDLGFKVGEMVLVTHHIQNSHAVVPWRNLSWKKRIRLKQNVIRFQMAQTGTCVALRHSFPMRSATCSRHEAQGKPLQISFFKGNVQNDEPGDASNKPVFHKDSVNISYVQDREETLAESPSAQDVPVCSTSESNMIGSSSQAIRDLFTKWLNLLRTETQDQAGNVALEGSPQVDSLQEQKASGKKERGEILKVVVCYFLGLDATITLPLLIFIPLYMGINVVYGAEVSRELTPLWVIGPLVVALYVKLFRWMAALYVYCFKQAVKIANNLPTYCSMALNYISRGKVKEAIQTQLLQPVVTVKNLGYKEALSRMWMAFQEWVVEKYLDFVESIWPYYCRTIRFLKRANLI